MFNNIDKILEIIFLWIQEHGLKVLLVLVITWVLSHFMNAIITRVVRKLVPRGSFDLPSEEKKREDTLIKISQSFFAIVLWLGAIFVILDSLGVPVMPLLTGAGIIGVAIGFGSQSLVRDFINGLFIIAENQFRIGDVVEIGNFEGVVEGMTLRVTRLRSLDGTIHYIPNGEIKVASNKSKDFSMVDITINVSYKTKIAHLKEIIDKVGQDMAHDPEFMDHIIEAPKFLRIDDFSDYAITARILGKVYPKHQYVVTGELRLRLKQAFEAKDIDIPYPTRRVYNISNEDKK